MLTADRISVMNFENAIRGARNPMNSWERGDSGYRADGSFFLGPNDLDLAKRLYSAGSDHRKYLRQVFVSMDICAPLYWWKEFDTYKVATVANSTSTMHKIHSVPFALQQFSCDGMSTASLAQMERTLAYLEQLRVSYLDSKDKGIWRDIIQLLPESYNQLRTCTMSYETLINLYHARKNHKLTEWHTLCAAIEGLPYAAELIVGENH
ncbi:MAG: hypothetical protein RR022_01295 [Angelakisella sp.]